MYYSEEDQDYGYNGQQGDDEPLYFDDDEGDEYVDDGGYGYDASIQAPVPYEEDDMDDLDPISTDYLPNDAHAQDTYGAMPRATIRMGFKDQAPIFRGYTSAQDTLPNVKGLYSPKVYTQNHQGGVSKPFVYLPTRSTQKQGGSGIGGVMFVPQQRKRSVDFITWNPQPQAKTTHQVATGPERPFVQWLQQQRQSNPSLLKRINNVDVRIHGNSCKHCAHTIQKNIKGLVGPQSQVQVKFKPVVTSGTTAPSVRRQVPASVQRPVAKGIRKVAISSPIKYPLPPSVNAGIVNRPVAVPRPVATPLATQRPIAQHRGIKPVVMPPVSRRVVPVSNVRQSASTVNRVPLSPNRVPQSSRTVVSQPARRSLGVAPTPSMGRRPTTMPPRTTVSKIPQRPTPVAKPVDPVLQIALDRLSYQEGAQRLQALGLQLRKAVDGTIDFIEVQQGQLFLRVKFIPAKGRQPQEWKKFAPNTIKVAKELVQVPTRAVPVQGARAPKGPIPVAAAKRPTPKPQREVY